MCVEWPRRSWCVYPWQKWLVFKLPYTPGTLAGVGEPLQGHYHCHFTLEAIHNKQKRNKMSRTSFFTSTSVLSTDSGNAKTWCWGNWSRRHRRKARQSRRHKTRLSTSLRNIGGCSTSWWRLCHYTNTHRYHGIQVANGKLKTQRSNTDSLYWNRFTGILVDIFRILFTVTRKIKHTAAPRA